MDTLFDLHKYLSQLYPTFPYIYIYIYMRWKCTDIERKKFL